MQKIVGFPELGLYAVGFVVSTALGIEGGNIFFFDSKYIDHDKYSATNFAGLYGFTVLLPAAFTLFFMMSLMVYKMRSIPRVAKFLYFAFAVALGFTALVKSYTSFNVEALLGCGVFCFSADSADDDYPSKIGLKFTTGLILFLVLLPIVGFMLLPMSNELGGEFLDLHTAATPSSGVRMPDGGGSSTTEMQGGSSTASPLHYFPEEAASPHDVYVQAPPLITARTWKILILVASLLLFFPFILVVVMYFPSIWESFTPGAISEYAGTCSKKSANDISLGDAIRIKVNGACLTFWPDLQVYYFAIYATAILAIAAAHSRELRRLLHIRPKFLRGSTLGESFVLALFVFVVIFEFIYWYEIRELWNNELQRHQFASERLARTSGQVANVIMGLLIFPISRNNMWTYCFGLGWESMLWFHRLLGDIFLVTVFIHMVSWCVFYDRLKQKDVNVAGFGPPQYMTKNWFETLVYNTEYHNDNFTINLQTWVVIPFFVTHGVLTMSYIRRNFFEVFYYAHHLFMALFLTTIWHANSAWYYLLPGLALWFLDRILRTWNAYGSVKVLKCEALSTTDGGDVTMLSYVLKPLGFPSRDPDVGYAPLAMSMGQYAFINIPEISGAEWHPFSLSSAPGDASTTQHIKAMGPGTWTNKLHALVASSSGTEGLTLSVEGPYGSPFTVKGYRKILLVAGGIGITAGHSIFRGLMKQATSLPAELTSVELVWIVRDSDMIDMFKDTFDDGEKGGYGERFITSFYVTGKTVKESARAPRYLFQKGRPDIQQKVNNMADCGMDALVWHCGPKVLGDSCAKAAMTCGVDFRNDSFVL